MAAHGTRSNRLRVSRWTSSGRASPANPHSSGVLSSSQPMELDDTQGRRRVGVRRGGGIVECEWPGAYCVD